MAYYAWADIRTVDADGTPRTIERGKKVTKSDFPGIKDGDWQAMLDGGSIRDRAFPAPSDYRGSALDFLRESLQEAQAVSPVEEEEAVAELEEVVRLGSK